MNKYGLLLITAIASAEILAQYFIRKYHNNYSNYFLMFFGAILYLSISFMLLKTYDFEKMAIANILWNAMTTIGVAIVGYYVFKENLSLIQLIGFPIVIIGMILVNIG